MLKRPIAGFNVKINQQTRSVSSVSAATPVATFSSLAPTKQQCVCVFLCNKTTKMNPFYSLIPGQLGRATYQIYRRNKVLYSHHYQCGWLLFINLLQLESAGYSLSPMLLQSIKLVWTMCLLKIQSSLHKYKFVKYGLQDCPGALTECQNARRNRCDILAIYVVSWK